MPTNDGVIHNIQFFVKQDGEFIPLRHISEAELTADPVNPTPEQEYYAYFSSEPIEFTAKITSNLRAFAIFVKTGNDLYLRFPKKLRRRQRR